MEIYKKTVISNENNKSTGNSSGGENLLLQTMSVKREKSETSQSATLSLDSVDIVF